ncbi:putative zinc-binding alcohol dehydrogenase domain-containing protein 2 protein [Phaeoacremonium minimum UCRPA7]|uniref:Putative zinc-binding alcohol dehydrogenase domain-containing protein 2 protein n=1 Tax=Phaeoacremonium minimum (strain UCR-PA7) TaxID=1286976 RepID=R8B8L6_PHAM7|nr:putative zinc-binding alcohol dehydrogenase domain-containing protein 2 protein [Phaeoacremonium minimum UCRPA7]EON95650.1 putative zinc-binding alcohol dehydrogenase domain-containing protein 2 protein [Phaeoacremonium minimum UCRPA7]
MKAIDVKDGAGPAEALFINDSVPKPTAPEGWCIVKVKAFGINRMDIGQREGKYPLRPDIPKTLGVEFSGIVESFGSDGQTNGFTIGDEVFGLAYGGAYAEFIAASTRMIIHKPETLSWVQAAAIPEAWITAWQALSIGEMAAGKRVLWHAGASSVSIAGIQLSRALGASLVLATTGNDDKCQFLKQDLGVDAAFNYRAEGVDWADEVLKATGGQGVDIILDFVGAPYFAQNLKVGAMDSRFVMVGALGGWKLEELDYGPWLFKRMRIEATSLRSRSEDYQAGLIDALKENISGFESGNLRVLIEKAFAWEEVQKAHRLMEKNISKGSLMYDEIDLC